MAQRGPLRRTSALAAATALGLSLAAATVGLPPSAAATGGSRPTGTLAGRTVVVGTAPAVPTGSARVGPLSPSDVVGFSIALRPRDPAGLARFVQAVSTPGSPAFHRYLAPGRFAAEFGASPGAIATVEAGMRADGLRVGGVAADRLSIDVSGTEAAVGAALGVSFARFRLASGRIGYSSLSAPRVAAALGGAVQAVVGLSTLASPQPEGLSRSRSLSAVGGAVPGRTGTAVPGAIGTRGPGRAGAALGGSASGVAVPCAAARSLAAQGSLTAPELARAYGLPGLYKLGDLAAGVTVALFELEPNRRSDIAAYQHCYGTDATVGYVKVAGGAGTGGGQGEAALDIEDVIGLAPRATIDVFQGPNTDQGAYETFRAIIDRDRAKVISTSWGICEAQLGGRAVALAEQALFQQAAAQGQTIVAAAGDDGSTDCANQANTAIDKLAVDDPGAQPYVTSVGGTTTYRLGPPPTSGAWNDASGAGGGGVSSLWRMPTYQSHTPGRLHVVTSFSSGSPCKARSGYCREVPDVSADADPRTGYIVYFDGAWYGGFGGTSAAAPVWAAVAALADASKGCGREPVGFLNPELYAIAGSAGYAEAFTDVVKGNNDLFGAPAGGPLYPAGPGFDMATGLGTPLVTSASGPGLASRLCSGSPPAAPGVLRVSPASGPASGGTIVTIHGWGFKKVTTVHFGRTAVRFTVASSTRIMVVAPPGTGDEHVTVTAGGRTTAASASDVFAYG